MKNDTCPRCGSKEIGQGKQTYQGKMHPIDSITVLAGSNIVADICTDCGYIIEMRVVNPELFK
nr:hypothetical protein [Tissierella sp.]